MVRYYCSGYDIKDPFGNGLGDMIKNELSNTNSVVYVVGSPKKPEKIEKAENIYKKNFDESFARNGIPFENSYIIKPDTNPEVARKWIDESSFLMLMGGDPFDQKEMCEELGIIDNIKNYKGIMMGFSAGAMLMSKNIIITPCSDEYPDFRIENGLNMDGISIHPHNNTELEEYPEVLCVGKESYKRDDLINVAKKYGDYYLIQDNKVDDDWDISIIKADNGIVSLYTENNGKIWEATPNGLNLVAQSKK